MGSLLRPRTQGGCATRRFATDCALAPINFCAKRVAVSRHFVNTQKGIWIRRSTGGWRHARTRAK
jgi:hypothetical protein